MKFKNLLHWTVIGVFVSLYLMISTISTIHVVDFFTLTNGTALAISLAIAFELGAAASLASLVILDKMNKSLVWALFITLTAMQAMGNMYYAYVNAQNFQGWIELFGLIDQDVIMQKRILAGVSGAILPLVALGFIKSLVDYIRPQQQEEIETKEEPKVEIEDKNQGHVEDQKDEYWFEKKEKEKIVKKPIEEPVKELKVESTKEEAVKELKAEPIKEPVEELNNEEIYPHMAYQKKKDILPSTKKDRLFPHKKGK